MFWRFEQAIGRRQFVENSMNYELLNEKLFKKKREKVYNEKWNWFYRVTEASEAVSQI